MNKDSYMLTDTEHFTPMPTNIAPSAAYRKFVFEVEKAFLSAEGSLQGNCFPIEHSFAEGIYMRTICIPKGFYVVGKLHKDCYPITFLSGTMSMLTEIGYQLIIAPKTYVSPALTKRIAFAHTDVVCMTAHPNPDNCTDIPTLEARLHLEEYPEPIEDVSTEEYEEHFNNFLLAMKKDFDGGN